MANGDMTSEINISGTDDSGNAYALSKSLVTSACTRVAKWRTPVPISTDSIILTISGTITGNAFASVTKAVFVNNGPTYDIVIGFTDTGAESAYFAIPVNDFFVLNSAEFETNATGGAYSGFATIDVVTAQALTAICDLDVIIYHV